MKKFDRGHLPDVIRFNAIDRYYVIPETDDPDGPYFPLSLVTAINLTVDVTEADLVRAVHAVDAKYPQFRLGYQLDYKQDRWLKVPDEALSQYLTSMVSTGVDTEMDEIVSRQIRHNITPFSTPLTVTTHGRMLVFKVQHSFGDGKYMAMMLPYIALAALDPAAFDTLPELPMNFGLPLWRVMWQTPQQGLFVLWQWIRTFPESYRDYKSSLEKPPSTANALEYRHSGSPMNVVRFLIPPEVMALLNRMRTELSPNRKLSTNTLLQVILAHRLMELGLQQSPPTFTQPVDLKLYLKQQSFYPGNLASPVRVTTTHRPEPDFRADCIEFQSVLERRVRRLLPIATLPSEWILALMGRKMYRKINRDWLQNPGSDSRFFILSNMASLHPELKHIQHFIAEGACMAFSLGLVGGPPLLVIFALYNHAGHATVTYDPRVLSREQIDSIMQAFTAEWLLTKWQPSKPIAAAELT